MINRSILSIVALCCILLVFITGCSNEESPSSATGGQVVAKVNDSEISIHQVNFELSRNQRLHQIDPQVASEVVVKQLVQQEVLVQKAKQSKLDRDPQVMQAFESAKRKILAQTYMQRIAAAVLAPTQAEIDSFINEHPEFFDKRRVYQLQEVAVDKNSISEDELQSKVKAGETFKDILAWLKSKNARIKASQGVKSAEQLPAAVAKGLLSMKAQQVAVIPTERAIFLFHLAAVQEQPVPADNVNKSAENYLLAQKRKQAAIDDAKIAYDMSTIEFMGQFAKLNQQATSMQDIEADIGVSLDESEKEATSDMDADLDAGLKGLK